MNSHQYFYFTKVSLDQCLLGQKSSGTIDPWTKVYMDNCPLDKYSNPDKIWCLSTIYIKYQVVFPRI